MTQSRRPSPLQRRVLIVLAALDENGQTRADAGHRTGAGAKRGSPGLRAKPARLLPSSGGCRLAAYPARSEPAAGSGADGRRPGRGTASAARRRHFCHRSGGGAERHNVSGLPWDFVVRLDGSTCLQLWNKEGRVVRREGDPLEVAQWLQARHDAGNGGSRTDK